MQSGPYNYELRRAVAVAGGGRRAVVGGGRQAMAVAGGGRQVADEQVPAADDAGRSCR
jgi:hypothetical protein